VDSDQRRGTNGWAVDELLSRGLKRLIKDLKVLEKTGFDDEICDQVKEALGRLAGGSGSITGATFVPEIISESDRFLDRYSEWNGQGTGDAAFDRKRKGLIEELYFWRNRMLTKLHERRKGYYIFVTDDDFDLIRHVYEQLEAIVSAYPDTFYYLRTSVVSFRVGLRERAAMRGTA
jgi:hypothetical protein